METDLYYKLCKQCQGVVFDDIRRRAIETVGGNGEYFCQGDEAVNSKLDWFD